MIDADDARLFAGYSPRHIRFYLLHYQVLETMGESPRTSRAAFTLLAREWVLLQDEGKLGFDCLCAALNDGLPTHEEQRSSGAARGIPLGADLRGDLTAAADALPLTWKATRHIYELQDRADLWAARLATHRTLGLPRPQDRRIEPPYDADEPLRRGSGALAVILMARHLGWREREQGAA